MYNFTREDIDLEAIRARIARMSDSELLKYGQSAAWMAEHNDRATLAGAARGGQVGVAPAACRGTRKQVNLPPSPHADYMCRQNG